MTSPVRSRVPHLSGGLDRPQPLMLLVLADVAVLELGPQFLLLGDQRADPVEGLFVLCHRSSLPDYGLAGRHTRDARKLARRLLEDFAHLVGAEGSHGRRAHF